MNFSYLPYFYSDAPSKNLASAKSSAAPLGYAPSAPTPAPASSSTSAFPPMPLSAKQQKESEDDMILKARLELAEMAIARQRARKAQESGTASTPIVPAPGDVTTASASAVESAVKDAKEIEEAEEAAKLEEKLIAKAKRKVEKDAIAAEEKREEEGREKRRLEKIRDNEEAKKMKEEQARQYEEFLVVKAARDVRPLHPSSFPLPFSHHNSFLILLLSFFFFSAVFLIFIDFFIHLFWSLFSYHPLLIPYLSFLLLPFLLIFS